MGHMDGGEELELEVDDQGTGDFSEGLEDLSLLELDQAEGQGDATDNLEDFYNGLSEVMPSPYSSSVGDGQETWQEDWTTFDFEEQLSEEEPGDYVPISRFLANDNHDRDQWFESPEDEEFKQAFACLSSRKDTAKKYLLEILDPYEDVESPYSDPCDDPEALQEVEYCLNDLHIPSEARTSVEKLSDLLVKYPSLDLRQYLVDMDAYTVAYVIWGIDFYMNRKCLNLTDGDHLSTDGVISEESSRLSNALRETWKTSFSWLSTRLSSLIANVV